MASPGEKYPRSLRGRMPRVAAFVDALRAAGWADDVDAALRNAKAGGTDFWASEGGSEFGARPAAAVESNCWLCGDCCGNRCRARCAACGALPRWRDECAII